MYVCRVQHKNHTHRSAYLINTYRMNKFTTVHSSGAIANRTSKSRTYTYATWAYTTAKAVKESLEAQLASADKEAAKYRTWEAAGGHNYQSTPSHSHWFDAKWCREAAEKNERRASALRNQLAAGVTDSKPWVLGWASRLDLAQKVASQYSTAARGLVVEITEAIPHTSK